jgi:signal transduction histidine kinase
MLQRLRQTLSQRTTSRALILSMILVVIVTVITGGLPAVLAISSELEQQVWLRVEDGQATTQALYQAETEKMATLSALIAQRPTLCSLLSEQDDANLLPYLNGLLMETGVDALAIWRPDLPPVGIQVGSFANAERFLSPTQASLTDYAVLADPPGLRLISTHSISPSEQCSSANEAWVVLAKDIDHAFLQTLSQQTGMVQNIIIGERRIVTSLSSIPDWPLNDEAITQARRNVATCCTRGTGADETYYLSLAPLLDRGGAVVALSEVALPGGAIAASARRTITTLFAVGFLVALGGSLLAIFLTRRITQPLAHLATTATRLAAGNLEVPFQSKTALKEISELTDHLEYARQQLRRAQLSAREEKERMERLLGAMHDGVVVLNESGIVSFFSPEAEHILARQAQEALHRHYREVFVPAPSEKRTMADVLRKPESSTALQHLTVLDGQQRPITLEISTSRLNYSKPFGEHDTALVLRDVSEKQAVDRLRSEFLANVSHEFRTPLTSVVATAELLLQEGESLTPQDIAELANSVRISTLQLQTLVDNLLESASIDAGMFRVRKRKIDLKDVIADAASMMAPLLARRHQELHLEIPENLTPLEADPTRLAQVLVNLIANASKFGPMDRPIRLHAVQEAIRVYVAILDEGPGLPAGSYADLFDRFVTSSKAPGAQYGLGLGLSVVKAIIEAHGGAVGAENNPEGGAKVWFTLPLTSHPGG